MEQRLEIYKTLIISTGHLSPATLNKLDPQWREWRAMVCYNQPVIIKGSALETLERTSSGWRLNILSHQDKEWVDALEPIGKEFINLIQLAIAYGCQYLEFHLDGPILKSYPFYAW
jgi:hypothetical protein